MLQKGVGCSTSSSSGPTVAEVDIRSAPGASPVAEGTVEEGTVAEAAVGEAAVAEAGVDEAAAVAEAAVGEAATAVAEGAVEECSRFLGRRGGLGGEAVGPLLRAGLPAVADWRAGLGGHGAGDDDGTRGRQAGEDSCEEVAAFEIA